MAGIDNDVIYGNNVDFSGGSPVAAKILLDGQLLIGRTSLNAGGTHIDVNTLTAGAGISITNGAGTITIAATGAATSTFTADVGTATPDGAGNLNLLGTSAQGISTSAAGSTVTFTIANASTVQKGVLLLASNAEAIAGTDTAKAITADDLKAKLGTQTLNAFAIGAGTAAAITWVGPLTNGQLMIGSTGNPPVPGTLTAGAGISITNGVGTITIAASGATPTTFTTDAGTATPAANNLEIKGKPGTPISTESPGAGTGKTVQIDLATVTPAFGGTGVVNPTAHTLPVAEGASNFTFLGPLTNGQLLIGNTGNDPTPNTLTAGSGITITNGAGTITIASTAGAAILAGSARNISTTAVTTSLQCALISTTPTTSNTASLISITYSPTSSSNILEFDFSCPMGAQSISKADINVFLFQGTTVKAGYSFSSGSGQYLTATFKFYQTAGTTSSTTWTVRWANSTSANPIYALCFSGTGTPLFNATGNSSMVFTLKEFTS